MATDWGRLTVVDLRHELKERGLSATGKKADLVERLTAAETEKRSDAEDAANASPVVDQISKTQDAPIETRATALSDTVPPELSIEDKPEAKQGAKSDADEKPDTTKTSPAPSPPASDPTRDNADADESLNPTKNPELMDITPAQTSISDDSAGNKDENGVPNAAVAELSPDLSKDARGRKRRSRTPPPSDDESSRKRARPSEEHDADEAHSINDAALAEEVLPLDDDPAGNDSSYAKLLPDRATEPRRDDNESLDTARQPDGAGDRSSLPDPDAYMQDIGDVEPSIHPATSALYIKNFMRPLKPEIVCDYLVDLATPPGRDPDPKIIHEFFLDPIRTHAFVQFDSVAAASRVRVRLHSTVWPEERNRKVLWVDFVPPHRIPEWIELENKSQGRGKPGRWELSYEEGRDGEVNLEMVELKDYDNTHQTRTRQISSTMPIPTGPARQFPGIEGAPSGPRGNGFYRDGQVGNGGGRDRDRGGAGFLTTTSYPQILYKPVANDLVQRRLHSMRSYYTTDRHRNMGREDEINRYTFEGEDAFVDRGVEVFVGIRRPPGVPLPHRQGGRDMGPRGPPPFAGSRYNRRRDIYPERDVPRSDVPRSRFNGAPLPTFGGGGNSRRRPYWGHR